eukprot:1157711-Pelagomonas_calceolata.AAC.14
MCGRSQRVGVAIGGGRRGLGGPTGQLNGHTAAASFAGGCMHPGDMLAKLYSKLCFVRLLTLPLPC